MQVEKGHGPIESSEQGGAERIWTTLMESIESISEKDVLDFKMTIEPAWLSFFEALDESTHFLVVALSRLNQSDLDGLEECQSDSNYTVGLHNLMGPLSVLRAIRSEL